jgi:hypothetical protein
MNYPGETGVMQALSVVPGLNKFSGIPHSQHNKQHPRLLVSQLRIFL